MLDFMWQVMRNPDSIKAVPDGIEDFFVKWREEFNAGVAGEELESDDSISNLWNVFSRERAPNIVPWLKRNRDQVWIKLYGGMPHPSYARAAAPSPHPATIAGWTSISSRATR